MVARASLAVVAVLVLAWLGIMERDARLQSRALSSARAGNVAQALTELSRASLLNPDTTPDLVRSAIHRELGQPARAQAGVERILRREPDNLGAWASLLVIAGSRDPAAARRAHAAIERLDPLSARPRGR